MPLTILQAAGTQPGFREPEGERTKSQWTRRQMLSSAERVQRPALKPRSQRNSHGWSPGGGSAGARRQVHARTSPGRAQPCSIAHVWGAAAHVWGAAADGLAAASARRRSSSPAGE